MKVCVKYGTFSCDWTQLTVELSVQFSSDVPDPVAVAADAEFHC